MSRPLIGITTGLQDGRQCVDLAYVQAVEAAGGAPLLLPFVETAEAAQALAQHVDGWVMTGGPGITRGLHGQLPPDLPPVEPERDRSDALWYQVLSARPLLGICYGMQFVNALAGGTIHADWMAQQPDAIAHSPGRGAKPHPVYLEQGSRLHHLLGADTVTVNTYHIQAVHTPGSGFHVVARAPDGAVEAIESDDGRLLGVQFHPERMGDSMQPLFADLVARCRSGRA